MIEMMMKGGGTVYDDFVAVFSLIDFGGTSPEYGFAYLSRGDGRVLTKTKLSQITSDSVSSSRFVLMKDARYLIFFMSHKFYFIDVNTFELVNTLQFDLSTQTIDHKVIRSSRDSDGNINYLFFKRTYLDNPPALTRIRVSDFSVDYSIAGAYNQTYPLLDIDTHDDRLYYITTSSTSVYYTLNYGDGSLQSRYDSRSVSFDRLIVHPERGFHLIKEHNRVYCYDRNYAYQGYYDLSDANRMPLYNAIKSRQANYLYASYASTGAGQGRIHINATTTNGLASHAAPIPVDFSTQPGDGVYEKAFDVAYQSEVYYIRNCQGKVSRASTSGNSWTTTLAPTAGSGATALCI